MPTPKFTPAEKARIRELMDDEAMTRAEAVADVLAYGLPADVLPAAPADRGCFRQATLADCDSCAWHVGNDDCRGMRALTHTEATQIMSRAREGRPVEPEMIERASYVLRPGADTCEAR